MAIEELLAVIPPPENPLEAVDNGAWERAQEIVGTKLPQDYLDYGLNYGTGTFCGFLGVVNPLSDYFESSVEFLLETTRDIGTTRKYQFRFHPDQPGLLPWGGDELGHTLHWLTEGQPDTWTVVLESHEGGLQRIDVSMTTFLAKAFRNEIRPRDIWHDPFAKDELVFSATMYQ